MDWMFSLWFLSCRRIMTREEGWGGGKVSDSLKSPVISLRERCLHDEVLKRRCLLKKSTFSKAFTGFIIFASSSEVPLSRWQRKEQLPQTDEQPVIFYFQVHVCAAHMITKPLKLVPLIQLGLDLQQLRCGPTCGEDVCGHGQESVRHDALRRHRDVELPRYVAVNVGPEVLQLITWTKQKRSNEKRTPLTVPSPSVSHFVFRLKPQKHHNLPLTQE